jgi:hypothetical protein
VKQICITPREGYDLNGELTGSVNCLKSAGIQPRTARPQMAYGIIWVEDEDLGPGLRALGGAGFGASEFTGDLTPA